MCPKSHTNGEAALGPRFLIFAPRRMPKKMFSTDTLPYGSAIVWYIWALAIICTIQL